MFRLCLAQKVEILNFMVLKKNHRTWSLSRATYNYNRRKEIVGLVYITLIVKQVSAADVTSNSILFLCRLLETWF